MSQPQTLALIHTSMVFLTVETMMKDLFAELLPGVRLINIVDDSLLADVMRAGQIPPAVASRMADYVVAAENLHDYRSCRRHGRSSCEPGQGPCQGYRH